MKIAGSKYYIEKEGDLVFLTYFYIRKGFSINQISYILDIPESQVIENLKKWYNFK